MRDHDVEESADDQPFDQGVSGLRECRADLDADPPKGEFIQISATYNHTCGLRAGSRKAVCWGASKHKQLKPPSDSPLVRGPNGEKVKTAYHHVAAGYYHTCAILNATRRAVCWGLNSHGQAPPEVPIDVAFASISAGRRHTCAVAAGGWSWLTAVCVGRLMSVSALTKCVA